MTVDTAADGLLGRRLSLAQPLNGYRVAIDPVFLAASVTPAPGELVLDAGCGSGAAALCLAVRCMDCGIVGVELDEELVDCAQRNVDANGFHSRIEIVQSDFAAYARVRRDRFDQVMINPPYNPALSHTASPRRTKAVAHIEEGSTLDGWLAAAATSLKPGGRLTLIHRADRLADILAALDRRFGAVLIFPLWPRIGVPAKRIIISAVKGRSTLPALLPGLTLHDPGGAFTAEADSILRDAAPLPWRPLVVS